MKRNPLRLLSLKELLIEMNIHAMKETLALVQYVHDRCTALTLLSLGFNIEDCRVQRSILNMGLDWTRLKKLSISCFMGKTQLLYDWLLACPNIRYLHIEDADGEDVTFEAIKERNDAMAGFAFPDNYFPNLFALSLPIGPHAWFHAQVILPLLKASPNLRSFTGVQDFFGLNRYSLLPRTAHQQECLRIERQWRKSIPCNDRGVARLTGAG